MLGGVLIRELATAALDAAWAFEMSSAQQGSLDPQLHSNNEEGHANGHGSVISAPATRTLPSPDVSDATVDDAYVQFIMYCNPSVPSDISTIELKKTFRSPPKSDGKTFNTFTLFELIRKLESKELKTWAQLAIELGVEPPALEKGQSAQKIQQYAVRLKVRGILMELNVAD